jgi:hypothetical protein
MHDAIDDAHSHNWQVSVHANGDVTIDMVLKAYERALPVRTGREVNRTVVGGKTAYGEPDSLFSGRDDQDVRGGVWGLDDVDPAGHQRRAGRGAEHAGVDRLHLVGRLGLQAGGLDVDRLHAVI